MTTTVGMSAMRGRNVTGRGWRYRTMLWAVVALLVAAAPSAAKRKRVKLYDCDGKIAKALERYGHGWYSDARTILEEVLTNCGGHSSIDTAVYYLGMSMLRAGQAVEAKGQFRRLVSNYPSSAFAEEATFRQGQCSFLSSATYDRDQTETQDAIRELAAFLQSSTQPEWVDSARTYIDKCRDKLARKEYMSARFYDRIDKYDAAVVYYRSLIESYPGSTYVPEARLYLAQALARTERVTEARAVAGELLESDYSEDIKRRARQLLVRIAGGE
jgi:outer membrane assembly lipoprotein YfiO